EQCELSQGPVLKRIDGRQVGELLGGSEFEHEGVSWLYAAGRHLGRRLRSVFGYLDELHVGRSAAGTYDEDASDVGPECLLGKVEQRALLRPGGDSWLRGGKRRGF